LDGLKIGEKLSAELETKHKVVVKYFTSPTCIKCKQLKPFIEELRKIAEVTEYSMDNADGLAEISLESIQAFPSLIIEVDGIKKAGWFGDIEPEQIKGMVTAWD